MRTSAQPGSGYPAGDIHGGQGFVTDTHTMVTSQQYLEHVGSVMTSEVDKLISNLDGLNPKTWDGDAYRAFLSAKDAWHQKHGEIQKALADIAANLGSSAKRYDQADLDSQYGIANAVKGLDYTI
jgi:WXG100 family type VII secretion target